MICFSWDLLGAGEARFRDLRQQDERLIWETEEIEKSCCHQRKKEERKWGNNDIKHLWWSQGKCQRGLSEEICASERSSFPLCGWGGSSLTPQHFIYPPFWQDTDSNFLIPDSFLYPNWKSSCSPHSLWETRLKDGLGLGKRPKKVLEITSGRVVTVVGGV